MTLSGRTVVITGAASGIGLATAASMLEDGWHVISIDLQRCPLPEVVSHIGDVADTDWLGEVAASLESQIAALVTAAGIWDADRDGNAETLSLESWHRTLAVNLTGTMLAVRHFQPLLSDGGAIVTLASIAALAAMPRRDAYTASKGGIVALTRSWAVDYSRRAVRVNCVCPGVTETPLVTSRQSDLSRRHEMALPQQRMATPSEVGQVVKFLASPESSFMSGAIVPVDGGTTALAAGLPFPRCHQSGPVPAGE